MKIIIDISKLNRLQKEHQELRKHILAILEKIYLVPNRQNYDGAILIEDEALPDVLT